MTCPEGQHDLRVINPFVHPTEKDRDGKPLEIYGGPPQSEEEHAWCRNCGALWTKAPFGMGWGFQHHTSDHDAPTLINLIREAKEKDAHAAERVAAVDTLAMRLRDTADRLEAGENKGGLTGVVLVVEAVPGVFSEDLALTGAWVSMRGGEHLDDGLRSATADVEALRRAKKARVQ
jgi:hypothetical protein